MAERVRMVEDVARSRRRFSSLMAIKGLTPEVLSKFISRHNCSQREAGEDSVLPCLKELRDISPDSVDEQELKIKPGKDESTFEDNGNVGVATLTTCHPEKARLDNLFKALDINKNDWEIERIQPNSWQTMTSVRGIPEIVTLYQMKAWLRRKTPILCEWPIIQPISLSMPTIQKLVKPDKVRGKLRCTLVIPDSQNGYSRDMRTGILTEYHDRRAWEIAYTLARQLVPDQIILIGDHCDLPEWSDKFVRSPEMYWTTQPMILELHWMLARLRGACPDAEIVYIEGNHEARLQRAVTNNLVASYGLQSADDFSKRNTPSLSIPRLLDLDTLGIRYEGPYPGGEVWINDNIKAEHGSAAKGPSLDTAKVVLARSRSSTIFGHIHRREVATKNEYRKSGHVTYQAECFGCICHVDGRVPANGPKNDWNQGLGIVWWEPGNGLFRTEHIPIHDGAAIYGNQVIIGKPDLKLMSRECGWKFEG